MRKFLNDPRQFVPEFLEGVALASGGALKYEPKYNLIYRADMPKANKVSVIQGSGSGHEPAHTMIVGKGMLDAACPGDVFAGPPVEFVTETTKLMNSPMGVLYIVNNYTGDRTAWDMARELSEAEGMKIGYLLVNDDVAVKDST
jgi:dihydroxyacetone kinase-like protein